MFLLNNLAILSSVNLHGHLTLKSKFNRKRSLLPNGGTYFVRFFGGIHLYWPDCGLNGHFPVNIWFTTSRAAPWSSEGQHTQGFLKLESVSPAVGCSAPGALISSMIRSGWNGWFSAGGLVLSPGPCLSPGCKLNSDRLLPAAAARIVKTRTLSTGIDKFSWRYFIFRWSREGGITVKYYISGAVSAGIIFSGAWEFGFLSQLYLRFTMFLWMPRRGIVTNNYRDIRRLS